MTNKVEVRYNDDSGYWHVFIIFNDSTEIDIGWQCDEQDAEDLANDLNRWREEK